MTEREIPDHRRDHYRATIVTIFHDGEVVEARDLAGRLGETIHVITAWNPIAERPGDDENRRRNEELRAELAKVIDPVLDASVICVTSMCISRSLPHNSGRKVPAVLNAASGSQDCT